MQLRAAGAADREALARLWHDAWHDTHATLVPPALLPHRTLAHYRALVARQLAQITVAVVGERLAGFVGVDEDELELLFVGAEFRGGTTAPALLAHGEREIARRFERAYLVVVEANLRARRFYERQGWQHVGPEHYTVLAPEGEIAVTSLRYEKRVRA